MADSLGIHQSAYALLVKVVAEQSADLPTVLDSLKYTFSTQIASRRRYECIRTLGDLLDCLMRRDAISENEAMEIERVHRHGYDPCQKYKENCEEHRPAQNRTGYVNQYQQLRLADELQHKLNVTGCNGRSPAGLQCNDAAAAAALPQSQPQPQPQPTPTPKPPARPGAAATDITPLTPQKRNAIYKLLSSEIGSYWRSFGRELDIREGALDAVELQFPRDLPSRIFKLLELFVEEADSRDPQQQLQLLGRALERCRRKDLRRKVDQIMSSPDK